MFYLFQSNRLESLTALFARIQEINPLPSALTPEQIVVQSQGMRRYLNVSLAKELGIAANLKFSLPAGLAWQLMKKVFPDTPALSPFAPEVMRWRLLNLFRSDTFQTASAFAQARAVLQGYLESSESSDYLLAGELADIFDQYLVYRPEWIDSWQEGRLLGLGEDESWQAQLWQYLNDGSQSAHRVALWENLLASLDKTHLPERLFVFGISTMAPMYLQLLKKISEHCDVFLFALNPSGQYWGNVVEAAQLLKSDADADLSQTGHPLLASLGKQGRDFFDFLTDIELEEQHIFDDIPEDTLLHCLQNDIQNLQMPSEHPDIDIQNDESIRIVSAHSPLRELEILKDKLLDILHRHPDWQPHDIAVLTPHIEPYTPFIEAVFGQNQEGAQALPYSISDVKLSRRQPLLHALEQTLDLLESRFETDKVLPLTDSPPVLRRFGLSEDDLPLLHDAVAELNVHWGLDQNMRNTGDKLFTWQQALDRITLGWMLPDSGTLWQNTNAWHSDINHIDTFGKFTALIHTLADISAEWNTPADTAEWTERLRRLIQALFLPDENDQYALQQFEQALAAWQEETELAGFHGTLNGHTVIRHIRRFLGSENQAGFLRGGITFCSMVPMRSLPFKVICLLGLNDGDFPRNTKASALDLIAKHPQKGDRARRDDDRYLFLEAIISARDILYLSYIGRSIRNDDELAPSALIGELSDTLSAMTGKSGYPIEQHPLQAFSRRYFTPDTPLLSTRKDYAEALNMTKVQPRPFITETLHETLQTAPAPIAITQDDFIRFWKNPVKTWLYQNLEWREPYFEDTQTAEEPFEPQHTGKIAAAYLDARRNKQDFGETAHRLEAESLLPAGELGRLWQQNFQTAAKHIDSELLESPKLPPVPYEIRIDGQTLQGSLTRLYRCGQVFYTDRKPNAPQLIALRLAHLIFCAAAPTATQTRKTYIVQPEETAIYDEIPQNEARDILQNWLKYYTIGQTTPLPFFAKTALAAAEAYCKKQDWEDALGKARISYYGSKVSKGQKDYTEVALVFGREETEPVNSPLFQILIQELLVPLINRQAQADASAA